MQTILISTLLQRTCECQGGIKAELVAGRIEAPPTESSKHSITSEKGRLLLNWWQLCSFILNHWVNIKKEEVLMSYIV